MGEVSSQLKIGRSSLITQDRACTAAPEASGGSAPRPQHVMSHSQPMMRSVDVVLAGALLLFTAPLILSLAAMVRADGGPALYRQVRVGKGMRPFSCLKIRTMKVGADAELPAALRADPAAAAEWRARQKLSRDPRVTPLGRFLRASNLDELPQLVNVLRGEMSLVGPRPVPADELAARYGHRARHYAACLPGITGLWQVSGRSWTTYRRRVALDCWYAKNRSLPLNARILMQTAWVVVRGHGAETQRPRRL